MLIPLFLHSGGVLYAPSFYLSEYFDANREEYIISLENLSRKDDWQGWVEFFLRAISEQADTNLEKLQPACGERTKPSMAGRRSVALRSQAAKNNSQEGRRSATIHNRASPGQRAWQTLPRRIAGAIPPATSLDGRVV